MGSLTPEILAYFALKVRTVLSEVAIPENCPPVMDFKGKSSKDYLLPFLDNGGKGIKFLLRQLQGF